MRLMGDCEPWGYTFPRDAGTWQGPAAPLEGGQSGSRGGGWEQGHPGKALSATMGCGIEGKAWD